MLRQILMGLLLPAACFADAVKKTSMSILYHWSIYEFTVYQKGE